MLVPSQFNIVARLIIHVQRDEKVGVYGFVFHRDGICVDVIVGTHLL